MAVDGVAEEGAVEAAAGPSHPGEVLYRDFLKPLGITANALAVGAKMPASRVGEILHGRRAVSMETALRLARFLGTSAEFWVELQVAFDLARVRAEMGSAVELEVTPFWGVGGTGRPG